MYSLDDQYGVSADMPGSKKIGIANGSVIKKENHRSLEESLSDASNTGSSGSTLKGAKIHSGKLYDLGGGRHGNAPKLFSFKSLNPDGGMDSSQAPELLGNAPRSPSRSKANAINLVDSGSFKNYDQTMIREGSPEGEGKEKITKKRHQPPSFEIQPIDHLTELSNNGKDWYDSNGRLRREENDGLPMNSDAENDSLAALPVNEPLPRKRDARKDFKSSNLCQPISESSDHVSEITTAPQQHISEPTNLNGNPDKIPKYSSSDAEKKLQFRSQISAANQIEIFTGDDKLFPLGQSTVAPNRKNSPLESLPSIAHYTFGMRATNVKGQRPSLTTLHGAEKLIEEQEDADKIEDDQALNKSETEKDKGISEGPKFGWIKGVLVRCLLNIWSVMLFLRLSWVVGQAGIGFSTIIIAVSTLVIVITAMSMAAICTNGEIKGGGAYYMLSRSLGPEFGGAIGIIFSLANAVTVSMNAVGLAETIVGLIPGNSGYLLGIANINWVRIIACLITIVLLGIVMAGLDWETKAQVGFLIMLMFAFASYFVGTFLKAKPPKLAKGVLGYHGEIFLQNFGPGFRGESFFSVFAIFFPSFTGFLAGCNISGDLKNAQTAIPKGTFWAIFITSMSYVLMVWTFGASMIRDASGQIADVYQDRNTNGNILSFPELFRVNSTLRSCVNTRSCKYGLRNDYQAAELQAAFGPLITIGIFASTLSSAIASLEGAAKVFQALSKDRLFPIINYFARGTKKHDEPVRAFLLMFVIAILCDIIANLNILAPIISNFFLMSFALINYACFDTFMSNSVGFRPGYRYYNHWVSLLGGLLCIVVMFLIEWWATLLVFFCVMFLYAYVHYKKPENVNWGSSSQAHVYKNALNWIFKLNDTEDHVKNFRPQILVLTGDPRNRPMLVDFVNYFTKNLSLMICGHVVLDDTADSANKPSLSTVNQFFRERRVKALYDNIGAPNLRQGTFALLEVAGLGRLKPNILILGFMSNWRNKELNEVNNYFYIIHDAFDLQYGVGIFKVPDGLFYPISSLSGILEQEVGDRSPLPSSKSIYDLTRLAQEKISDPHVQENDAKAHAAKMIGDDDKKEVKRNGEKGTKLKVRIMEKFKERKQSMGFQQMVNRISRKRKNSMASINMFQCKQPAGVIDIWWLFDDGGLTILLPYILAHRQHWESCKIRLFGLCDSPNDLERVKSNFVALLAKFRIEYSEVYIIPDIHKAPSPYSIQEFDSMIQSYRVKSVTDISYLPGLITDEEYIFLQKKTHMQIRLHEILMKYSQTSRLVIMTLLIPRKSSVSTAMYMAWLEIITKDMPPFLFIRGNQQSVITFYS